MKAELGLVAVLLLAASPAWAGDGPKASLPTLPNSLVNGDPAADRPVETDAPTDSLGAAIAEAYAGNPLLAARRYELRATDDEIGIALAQMRPSAQVQVSAGYDLIQPGDITQANRSLSDRLNNPNIEKNDVATQFVLDQPLWTGGRVSSAVRAAVATSNAGRETLRSAEGDLLLDLIGAYADVRRDTQALAFRQRNLAALDDTFAEIVARREAGELTRTDIAQTETQRQTAQAQLNLAEAQLQSSRAAFAALVGREPGRLAPEPELPGLPGDLDQALARSEQANPDLAAAIATERASRARIALAKAEGAPQLTLRGTAGTTGPLSPFDRRDQDVSFSGRATLSIPLSAGGRIHAQIAQAQNRNTADERRIEGARRQMVQALVTAWNQWATAERNIRSGEVQLEAARVFYDGTYAEYREGLRSTFDVLYALSSVREAEIALVSSQRDSYVARAAVLRRTGQLEASQLLEAPEPYDPDRYGRAVRRRGAVPWGSVLRSLDRIGAPEATVRPAESFPVAEPIHATVPAPVNPPAEVTSRVSGTSRKDTGPLPQNTGAKGQEQ